MFMDISEIAVGRNSEMGVAFVDVSGSGQKEVRDGVERRSVRVKVNIFL